MLSIIYTLISITLISLISLLGIFTLILKEDFIKKYLPILVSLAAGAMLGETFIHLLPEIYDSKNNLYLSLLIIFSITFFFILEKILRLKHQHCLEENCESHHPLPFGYLNLISDGFHNFIDGAIIAGSFTVSIPLGLVTTTAILLHEIPQEICDFGLLLQAGFSIKKALIFNLLSASSAFLGAGFAYFLGQNFNQIILALTAGGFIYIAGTDLLPELHKETKLKSNLGQITSLLFGIVLMILMTLVE